MPRELPPLPWPATALAPCISQRTVDLHWGKHHRGYLATLDKLLAGTDRETLDLYSLVRMTVGDPSQTAVFNAAGQAWNHDFYWKSLTPDRTRPSDRLASAIDRDLGGFEAAQAALIDAATAQFGSGWAWLVADAGRLRIESSSNADTPIAHGRHPLLTIDVWEHAYYVDYENRRPEHVAVVVEKLLNWEFASENLARLLEEQSLDEALVESFPASDPRPA
jgi:Fe-Mn family superoxide dismutase